MKHSDSEKRRCIARLQAAGIPVPSQSHSRPEPDIRIECLPGSRAFDLKTGSECLLSVRISNVSYARLQLYDPRANLLDEDWAFSFQQDARQHEPERKMYRMLSGRRIGYDSVLNHRLSSQIAPGGSIEGWLLAFNLEEKIPCEYLDRQMVPLQLVLTDQYGRDHESICEVRVDRTETMPKPRIAMRVGRSLYRYGCWRAPEFDHSLKARNAVAEVKPAETANIPDAIKSLRPLLQRPDLDFMMQEWNAMEQSADVEG
jgi:hypothetical protein